MGVQWGESDAGYLSPNNLLFQCSFLNSLISQPLAGIHFPPFHVNSNVNLLNQFSQYVIYVRQIYIELYYRVRIMIGEKETLNRKHLSISISQQCSQKHTNHTHILELATVCPWAPIPSNYPTFPSFHKPFLPSLLGYP